MKTLREKITLTIVENSTIDIDNRGQERYTLNEEQIRLLINELVEKTKDICNKARMELRGKHVQDLSEYKHWIKETDNNDTL